MHSHAPLPEKPRCAPHHALTEIGAAAVFISAHGHVCLFLFHAQFQRAQARKHFRGDQVVCVQPHQQIAARIAEGSVAGGGKVVCPWKEKNTVGKASRNFLCPVRASRIDDHNFVRFVFYAVQASFQYLFFVPHDHAD